MDISEDGDSEDAKKAKDEAAQMRLLINFEVTYTFSTWNNMDQVNCLVVAQTSRLL